MNHLNKKLIVLTFISIFILKNTASNVIIPEEKINDYSFLDATQDVKFSLILNILYLHDNDIQYKLPIELEKEILQFTQKNNIYNIYIKEFLKEAMRLDSKNLFNFSSNENNTLDLKIDTSIHLKTNFNGYFNVIEITSLKLYSSQKSFLNLKKEIETKDLILIKKENLIKDLEKNIWKLLKTSIVKNLEFIFVSK